MALTRHGKLKAAVTVIKDEIKAACFNHPTNQLIYLYSTKGEPLQVGLQNKNCVSLVSAQSSKVYWSKYLIV